MERKWVINKKKNIFYTVIIFIPIAFVCLVYIGYAAYRTTDFYQNIKTKQRGWKGNVSVADVELGFAPVPNSQGYHVFPIGPDVPMRYDENGFRAPMESEGFSMPQKPLILALGGSFTYGDATHAKDTYPYLVGQFLKGTSKNAGRCSAGLSQMLILAKKLIPIHKPDYLLVQYSTWLVDRAQNPFAPSYYGKLPNPFFYMKDNSFALQPPVFLTKIMELPIQRYRNTPYNVSDALSFFWNAGLPLFFHDDFKMLKYKLDRSLGVVPNPTKAREELIEYVYRQIDNVAKENGAKLVIVVLGKNVKPIELKDQLFPPDALLVNGQEALLEHFSNLNMGINNENYKKVYAHWRGSPPRVVDKHPNETAHKIIADAIVSEIKQADI